MEVLIVVVIIGVLAAIVIPQFANATESARKSAFVADVNTFAERAFLFMAETNELLPDSSSGQCPAGFENYIDPDKWEAGTPIGGVWDAERDGFADSGMLAGFGVHFNNGDDPGDDYMRHIDEMLDDGDLDTGGFRKVDTNRFYFLLLK